MRKVWITRTLPRAKQTADKLLTRGFDPVIAPLLRVLLPDTQPDIPDDKACLIFTSQNGVSTFCELTRDRHWRVVTVGDATAAFAKAKGFDAVSSAQGTSKDVTNLIQHTIPKDIPIIHCSGSVVQGRITENLSDAGYAAKWAVFYKTEPALVLPDIDLSDIDYVLLHSPLAARTLRDLRPDLSDIITISISEAAHAELGTLVTRENRIANAPNETALLACLP